MSTWNRNSTWTLLFMHRNCLKETIHSTFAAQIVATGKLPLITCGRLQMYRDIWERDLPRYMLYQLVVYAISHREDPRSTIVYPTFHPAARETRIDVTHPVTGGRIGQVILRKNRAQYYISQELFSFEPFALAIPRGDADFQLVADRALSQLNRSGQIVNIYRKWFGRFAKDPPIVLKALYQLNATPE